jgi:site-specific recombinase XerD
MKHMKVKEALATYELTIYNLSEETQIWYMGKLRIFASWCEDRHIPLEKVTPVIVRQFIDERRFFRLVAQSAERIGYDGHWENACS